MIDLSKVRNYYIATGYTDLRRGIDGLASIVQPQYDMELKEDSLFLFCGRRTDRIKALYCDSHDLRPSLPASAAWRNRPFGRRRMVRGWIYSRV